MVGRTWICVWVLVVAATSIAGCVGSAVLDSGRHERGTNDVDALCGDYGCEEGYDETGTIDVSVVDDAFLEQPVDLRDSRLEGDLGEIRGFRDEEPLHRGYAVEDYAVIEVHAEGPDGEGAAMVILEVEGGLDHPLLAPGAHLEFGGAVGYDRTMDTPLRLDIVGCAGPIEGNWVFDEPASELLVDVTEGATPDSLVLEFTATFESFDPDSEGAIEQTVFGSVEVGSTHPE